MSDVCHGLTVLNGASGVSEIIDKHIDLSAFKAITFKIPSPSFLKELKTELKTEKLLLFYFSGRELLGAQRFRMTNCHY